MDTSELIKKHLAVLDASIKGVRTQPEKLDKSLSLRVTIPLWEDLREFREKVNEIDPSSLDAPKTIQSTFSIFLRAVILYGAGFLGGLGPKWNALLEEQLLYLDALREKFQELTREEGPE